MRNKHHPSGREGRRQSARHAKSAENSRFEKAEKAYREEEGRTPSIEMVCDEKEDAWYDAEVFRKNGRTYVRPIVGRKKLR